MKVFAVEHPVDILLDYTNGAVYAWLLDDKKLCSRCVANEKFS
ncbi:hypothetical protein [Campylobacter concisus]|nr:hypothetical protein [Campylobacter concisus]